MSYVMVDVEADGPIPGDYSMVCFGAVVVEPSLSRTFYSYMASPSVTEKCNRSVFPTLSFQK
jgi:hypothetical protein